MVVAHELGHGLGDSINQFALFHSSGPYVATFTPAPSATTSGAFVNLYDSWWDVMSYALRRGNCPYQGPPFGCIAPGFISFNKDSEGWINLTNEKIVVGVGSSVTLNIQRLARPQLTLTPGATNPYLMAQIPIGGTPTGTPQFYTVENRQSVGYDVNIPTPNAPSTPSNSTILINNRHSAP